MELKILEERRESKERWEKEGLCFAPGMQAPWEKAKRLGLVFLGRCRDHCPRSELNQVSQRKATEKVSLGREAKEKKVRR